MVDAGGTISILAGDNLTEEKGASIQAGVSIFLNSDYAGDLNGVPPRMPTPTQFVTIGTTILLAGLVAAPTITIQSADGPDTITATATSVLNAAYPWTAKTFPPQLGRKVGSGTGWSLITIIAGSADDKVSVLGSAVANNIDIIGGDGADTIALTPTNTADRDGCHRRRQGHDQFRLTRRAVVDHQRDQRPRRQRQHHRRSGDLCRGDRRRGCGHDQRGQRERHHLRRRRADQLHPAGADQRLRRETGAGQWRRDPDLGDDDRPGYRRQRQDHRRRRQPDRVWRHRFGYDQHRRRQHHGVRRRRQRGLQRRHRA